MGWAEISAHPILLVGWRSLAVSFRFQLNGFACMVRVAGFLIAVLALLGVLPASASAAVPTASPQGVVTPAKAKPTNITFGAGPASKKGPDGRTLFTYDASPGGRIKDHIAILNLTRHAETLRVYTVDVDPGTNGGFFFPPRTAPRVGAGAWVAVGTPHAAGFIRAKPRSTTILPIHLTVPSNASPGDHVAAVVVSLTGHVKGGQINGSSGQDVNLEQRVATRVLVRVSGTIRPQLSIESLKAHYAGRVNPFAGGTATVTYLVRNTGNAILGGSQEVSIHGLFGSTTHAGPLAAIPPLLPGGSYAMKVHVPDVFPEFLMTANVQVTPEGLTGAVDPGLHAVTSKVKFWAIPWILIGIIVLLVLIVAGAIIRRRRRARETAAPLDVKTPEGVTP
jgi:hypothetical protein